MTKESIADSEISAVKALMSRARERGLESIPVQALRRLVGLDRESKVAQSVGLSLDGEKYRIPDMSFTEVIERLSAGQTLPGIKEVENKEINLGELGNFEYPSSAKKPWEI